MIHLKKFRATANFLFFLIILSAFAPNRSLAQALTQFYGVNAWLPNGLGGNYDTYVITSTYQNFRNSSNLNSLNAEMVRVGGIEFDRTNPQYSFYSNMIQNWNTAGANLTPIVQLPIAYFIDQVWQANSNTSWTNVLNTILAQSSNYKNYLENIVYNLLLNERVRYWSIGNEPDGWASKFGDPNALTFLHTNFSTNPVTATEIARYTKDIAGFVRGI